jgi:hypothetical protein
MVEWQRTHLVAALVASLWGCAAAGPPAVPSPVDGGALRCADGVARAVADAGEVALCLWPTLACEAAAQVEQRGDCHPGAFPASGCCAPRPGGCDPADCDCLLRRGPWIDFELAADAGLGWPYSGPRAVCSYRLHCRPGGDGGVPVVWCTPA